MSIEDFSSDLKELSKKALYIKERLKIFKIKNNLDKLEAIKYTLYSKLELKYQDLSIKLRDLKNKNKDVSSSEQYLSLLPFKVQFFKLEPTKENFYNALLLIKKIEEGMK